MQGPLLIDGHADDQLPSARLVRRECIANRIHHLCDCWDEELLIPDSAVSHIVFCRKSGAFESAKSIIRNPPLISDFSEDVHKLWLRTLRKLFLSSLVGF